MKHHLIRKQLFPYENKQGYIALISILIISALVVLIATSANLFSISESKMGLEENQSWQAYYLANLCAEEALMTLKNGGTYTEEEIINMENGSCTIFPIEGNWTIKVSGSVGNMTRKIKIEINSINPEIEISSWQKVADF